MAVKVILTMEWRGNSVATGVDPKQNLWHPLRNLQHVLALAASALAGTASLVSAVLLDAETNTSKRSLDLPMIQDLDTLAEA